MPFVQYGSSGEQNYNGVSSYPNQLTLHFGSPESKNFLTYNGGSFGPLCIAFRGSVEGISVSVVADTVAISTAVAVSVTIATVCHKPFGLVTILRFTITPLPQ